MSKIEIVPSILSADFAVLKEEIRRVEKAGCRRLHLDIMDGHFVPNITIGPVVIKSIRRITGLYLQTHLMIEKPERYIKDFKDAGSDCIIIHKEATSNFISTIKKIKKMGIDAGVALRPKTPVGTVKRFVRDMDMILVMTVEPGFGGQAFLEGTEKKVAEIKALLKKNNVSIPIGVDGGVNVKTASLVASHGATHLIAGNAVFKGNVIKNIKSLYNSIA